MIIYTIWHFKFNQLTRILSRLHVSPANVLREVSWAILGFVSFVRSFARSHQSISSNMHAPALALALLTAHAPSSCVRRKGTCMMFPSINLYRRMMQTRSFSPSLRHWLCDVHDTSKRMHYFFPKVYNGGNLGEDRGKGGRN